MSVSLMMRLKHKIMSFIQHCTTDVYSIGYPKTGNTWTRFLLRWYLQLLRPRVLLDTR